MRKALFVVALFVLAVASFHCGSKSTSPSPPATMTGNWDISDLDVNIGLWALTEGDNGKLTGTYLTGYDQDSQGYRSWLEIAGTVDRDGNVLLKTTGAEGYSNPEFYIWWEGKLNKARDRFEGVTHGYDSLSHPHEFTVRCVAIKRLPTK